MAKVIKDLGNAIGSIAGTATVVISSTGSVVEALANSATTSIDGLSNTTKNFAEVATLFSDEMVVEARNSHAQVIAVQAERAEQLKSVLEEPAMKKKLQESIRASILEDLFD